MKIVGAVLIVAACGGIGLSKAAAHRRLEQELRNLIGVLEFMGCELQYRLTPLPELCRTAADVTRGTIRHIMEGLAQELEQQIAPDVSVCMAATLQKTQKTSPILTGHLERLGEWLGRFGLQGQLKSLDGLKAQCGDALKDLSFHRAERLRSYQTLGFCAGAALAILFI
ncbi:MAG: stage III sporulation protein AB [Oscillospiraceae bacterium]|nr:stage III sporulation protein AB [Oscillospiraceae bacterium]